MEHMAIIAISSSDFQKFGCPYCGGAHEAGTVLWAKETYSLWHCGNENCRHSCVVLSDGVKGAQVPINQEILDLELQPHPRRDYQSGFVDDESASGPSRGVDSATHEASAQGLSLPAMEIHVLWQVADASNAYVDQFGIPHRGFVVLDQIAVMVVEKQSVPSLTDSTEHEALRAASMQGKETFTRDWGGFIESSMAPGFYWDYRKDDRGIWRPVDACMAYNLKLFLPYVTPDGQRAVPLGADICRVHDYASLGEKGCIGCRVKAYRTAHAS